MRLWVSVVNALCAGAKLTLRRQCGFVEGVCGELGWMGGDDVLEVDGSRAWSLGGPAAMSCDLDAQASFSLDPPAWRSCLPSPLAGHGPLSYPRCHWPRLPHHPCAC